jgi:hypothetical protein
VTLSNPAKRNAIPVGAWPEIEAAFREVAGRRDDRCVVLTGEGDDFSSGADVTGAVPDDVGHPLQAIRSISGAIDALHALPLTLGQALEAEAEAQTVTWAPRTQPRRCSPSSNAVSPASKVLTSSCVFDGFTCHGSSFIP